jgi:hypothetical protein
MLAARVFEYSVRRHTSMPVVFDTMDGVTWPFPRDPKNQPLTNFSFHRFAIPRLAGFQGRALYVDADMIVFRDLRELWQIPFGDATVLYAPSSNPKRRKQFSVMLMDCGRLRWDVDEIIRGMDEGRYDYQQLLGDLCIEPDDRVRDGIPPEWNSLDLFFPGKTGLLHYTHMETQPWVSRRHKHGDLWVAYLRDAIADGVIHTDEVREAIGQGFLRPSLLREIQLPAAPGASFKLLTGPLLDRGFKPHRALRERQARVRKTPAAAPPPAP